MRRLATLLLLAAVAGPAAAAEIAVQLLSPSAGQPVFGEVEISAAVVSTEPIKFVDFFVDERRVMQIKERPFRMRINVGEDNREHRFRVVAHGLFGETGEASLVTPRIEVDEELEVQLVQLYVTVTLPNGRYAQNLVAEDFEISDWRGRKQQIATFSRGDIPISAVLLVDSSESMEGPRLMSALDGVRAFARGIQGLDEAMVILFSDRLLRATPFVQEASQLEAPLRDAVAQGGTALNDHLYLALNRLGPQLGRPVVVLLTDGTEVSSFLNMREVLWKVRRSQAILYWIRLIEREVVDEAPSFSSSWRNVDQNRLEFQHLQQAIVESGGRTLSIRWVGELAAAFRDVLRELRGQYILGFHPSTRRRDGSWRPVSVKVRGPRLQVRARGGYIDD